MYVMKVLHDRADNRMLRVLSYGFYGSILEKTTEDWFKECHKTRSTMGFVFPKGKQ